MASQQSSIGPISYPLSVHRAISVTLWFNERTSMCSEGQSVLQYNNSPGTDLPDGYCGPILKRGHPYKGYLILKIIYFGKTLVSSKLSRNRKFRPTDFEVTHFRPPISNRIFKLQLQLQIRVLILF